MQAHALTKCKKYLYSMSINPDPEQGPLTREQYMDYIDRAETRLGLSGQPRAVVFQIKHGREHCHVFWSRIDAFQEKAVHLPFDKDKLMMVTKEFARDHDLQLPDGYFKDKNRAKPDQVSVYDMAQQRAILKENQAQQRRTLSHRHTLQSLDMQRKLRALSKVERKELKVLEEAQTRQARIVQRGGTARMPSLALELRPRGRKAVPHKAKTRHYKPPTAKDARTAEELEGGFKRAVEGKTKPKIIDLEGDFNVVTTGKRGESRGESSEGRKPRKDNRIRRYGRKRSGKSKDNDLDRGR